MKVVVNRLGRKGSIFVAILGTIALIVGCTQLKKYNAYTPVSATISNIEVEHSGKDTTHITFVDYVVDGKAYKDVELGYYESGFYEGKEITIRYNPDDPGDVTGVSKSFLITMLIIGPGLMIFAVFSFLKG